MVKLSISDLIFSYILFSAVIILLAWMVFRYRRRKESPRKDADYIWKCSICLHDYIDSRHEDISVCPMCGSYNKKEAKSGV